MPLPLRNCVRIKHNWNQEPDVKAMKTGGTDEIRIIVTVYTIPDQSKIFFKKRLKVNREGFKIGLTLEGLHCF